MSYIFPEQESVVMRVMDTLKNMSPYKEKVGQIPLIDDVSKFNISGGEQNFPILPKNSIFSLQENTLQNSPFWVS